MQHQRQLLLSINPGAPASAVPRSWFQFVNNVLRFIEVRNGRLIVDNDKWTIECGIPKEKRYSFRVYAEIPDGEDKPHLYVDEGYIGVVDSDWVHVQITDLGEINSSGVVYARRIYPVIDEDGNICPGKGGNWESYSGNYFNYSSSVPQTNSTAISIRIANVTYEQSYITIFQEHFGNILVLDLANCTGDPCS